MAYLIIGSNASEVINDNYSYYGDWGDDIYALDGNDTIVMADDFAGDYVDGGYGYDLVSYEQFSVGVSVDLEYGTAWDGYSTDYLYDIEDVAGSYYGDELWGNAYGNFIAGLGGNDFIYGDGGDDLIEGGAGADIIDGSYGYDTALYVNSTAAVTVSLTSGVGSGGHAAGDALYSIEDLDGSNFGDSLTGNAGSNFIFGEAGNDIIYGVGGNDWIYGDAGNDTLNGGVGTDSLNGGAGNDTYVLENGADAITDSGGTDTVTSTITRTLAGNIEKLALLGVAAVNGTGNALANVMSGNAAANTLIGHAGNDTLVGNAGNDKLYGNAGIDSLTGGAGNDIFVFNAPRSAANRDVVTDFNHVADTFHIENAVFTKLGAGVHALASSMLRLGTKALDGNDFLIYNKATGVLSYDHDANGAGAAITVATLTNKAAIDASDFFVI